MSSETRGRGPSRRDFLKGLGATSAGLVAGSVGAGAGAPAAGAGLAPRIGTGRYPVGQGLPASRVDFGRIFPKLPPFAEASDLVRAALVEVGRPGGIMDAGDQLS